MSGIGPWLASPFNQDQSALRWFLFVGLILVSLGMWHMILVDVRKVGR